jgi:glycosyltransferase involved in cell wall biosynthesis
LGVSDRFHPPELREGEEVTAQNLHLLHVGHCGPYKNIEGILRALPIIQSRCGCTVTLLKAGLPFTRPQRELISQLGLENAVRHLGVVADSELPALYAKVDVLLIPSLYEGFGLPVLEAMACGTPVVASTAGALSETAGEAALLVDPLDIEGLADAVTRIANDGELRAKLRRRGLERARQFPWRRTALATAAVYSEVAEDARPD